MFPFTRVVAEWRIALSLVSDQQRSWRSLSRSRFSHQMADIKLLSTSLTMPWKRSIGGKIEIMRNAEDVKKFHEEILKAARLVVLTKRRNEFTVQEIVLRVREDYPEFSERAIGEAIATNSRQVAPARSGGSQVAFERIGPTGYRLVTRFGLATRIEEKRIPVPGRSKFMV
jgi:hypothetical protein